MTTGIIPSSAIPTPIQAPLKGFPFVDPATGNLTTTSQQLLQQMYAYIVSMGRIFPCNCTNVGNVYTLTTLPVAPLVNQYADGDMFSFHASASSTGTVTANVVARGTTLGTLGVFTAGLANASLTNNFHYIATFTVFVPGSPSFIVR